MNDAEHGSTPTGDVFCPALDVGHDSGGLLTVAPDPIGFERFVEACFR